MGRGEKEGELVLSFCLGTDSPSSTPFAQLTAGQVTVWLFLAPLWEGLICTWAASTWDSQCCQSSWVCI